MNTKEHNVLRSKVFEGAKCSDERSVPGSSSRTSAPAKSSNLPECVIGSDSSEIARRCSCPASRSCICAIFSSWGRHNGVGSAFITQVQRLSLDTTRVLFAGLILISGTLTTPSVPGVLGLTLRSSSPNAQCSWCFEQRRGVKRAHGGDCVSS